MKDEVISYSYTLKGNKYLHSCPFSEYTAAINFFYMNADYELPESKIIEIYKILYNRAVNGRLLPEPIKILRVFYRISKKTIKNLKCIQIRKSP